MKVALIARHLDLPVGYGTYERELIPALARAAPPGMEFEIYAPRRPKFKVPAGIKLQTFGVPETRSKLVWWEHVIAPGAAKREGADLVHHMAPGCPLLPIRRPVLTTVHDLIEIDLDGYKLPLLYRLLRRRDLRRASHLISVSQSTKKDLTKRGVSPKKITVIHEGRPTPPHGQTRVGKNFLFIGGTERRKGLRRVLAAFAAADLPAAGLDVVGVTEASPIQDSIDELMSELPELARKKVKIHGRVPPDKLWRLYRGALALVFLSRYEGFGLPPLEAMSVGTPVISGEGSSLPEVTGGAALLVDADDTRGLASAMHRVATDGRLRRRLISAGRTNVKRFDWDRAAEETIKVYKKFA